MHQKVLLLVRVRDGQPTRDKLSRTRRVDNFALAKKDYFKQKVPVRAFLLSHLPLCGIKKIHDRLKKLSLTVYPTGVYLKYEARHKKAVAKSSAAHRGSGAWFTANGGK